METIETTATEKPARTIQTIQQEYFQCLAQLGEINYVSQGFLADSQKKAQELVKKASELQAESKALKEAEDKAKQESH